MTEQSMKQICRIYETMDERDAYNQYHLNDFEFHELDYIITDLKQKGRAVTLFRHTAVLFAKCGFTIEPSGCLYCIK